MEQYATTCFVNRSISIQRVLIYPLSKEEGELAIDISAQIATLSGYLFFF